MSQKLVDTLYPPTMTFDISTLTPTKELKERVDKLPHDFFRGERLLDIGCAKGWFSVAYGRNFKEVVALEPDDDLRGIAMWLAGLHKSKITFYKDGFRDFLHDKQFDNIFMGNVHHHVHKECGNFNWIAKLAALSSNYVLIEGPKDSNCPDLDTVLTKRQLKEFDNFIPEMKRYFELVSCIPTIKYTPGRYMMLFRKIQFNFMSGMQMVPKKFRKDKYVNNNIITIGIAGNSPISNGVASFVDKGWLETRVAGKPFHYFEHELPLLKKMCAHNAFLASIGHIDIDLATINFMNDSEIYFDKSGVIPIKSISIEHINVMELLFNQSYNTMVYWPGMREALLTRDSVKIEEGWNEWLKRL